MPTGYTAKLVDKGQSFSEFVMTCARAFGACVEMREDSLDTQIPDAFTPSDYHIKALKEAQKTLKKLEALSPEDREKFGLKRKKEIIKDNESNLQEVQKSNKRISDMICQVMAWTPPSPGHIELKNFMLQQLEVSKTDESYYNRELLNVKNTEPITFYLREKSQAEEDITYHTKENLKEIERASERTEWVKKLRRSL